MDAEARKAVRDAMEYACGVLDGPQDAPEDAKSLLKYLLPQLERLGYTITKTDELAALRSDKHQAYLERNHLVALVARLFPSGIRETNIEGWDAEWNGCVYIDLPDGQISYHYHTAHAWLFADLPPYTKEYDGHGKTMVFDRQRMAWPARASSGQPTEVV